MTYMIKHPFFDAMTPSDIFDDLWKSFNVDSMSRKLSHGFPKFDLYLENGSKVIEVALAGYSKEQLSIEVDDNHLTISANRSESSTKNESRVLARRSFTKSFTDPTRVWNLDAAEVSFVDGLLKVVIPPMKQTQAAKKVLEIK